MDTDIAEFRAFNRFHTRLVGALNDSFLASGYSLPQVRVIYEIANAPTPPAAADLAEALRMDAGYLSRLLAGLEGDGLVARTPSGDNAKRLDLALTPEGQAIADRLDDASAEQIAALLAPLPDTDRAALTEAMATIRRLLDTGAPGQITLSEPGPGDLGWVVQSQAHFYATAYGWDARFEALVAEIAAKFIRDFIPGKERGWIARAGGRPVGSVFVVREDDATAKLRLLYVDAAARGQGLGARLVEECLAFAQGAGYRRMVLWTNDNLISARRIYQGLGFTLTSEEPHSDFGPPLVGQMWEREL